MHPDLHRPQRQTYYVRYHGRLTLLPSTVRRHSISRDHPRRLLRPESPLLHAVHSSTRDARHLSEIRQAAPSTALKRNHTSTPPVSYRLHSSHPSRHPSDSPRARPYCRNTRRPRLRHPVPGLPRRARVRQIKNRQAIDTTRANTALPSTTHQATKTKSASNLSTSNRSPAGQPLLNQFARAAHIATTS